MSSDHTPATTEHAEMLSAERYEPRGLEELINYAKVVVQSQLCPRHIQNPSDVVMIVQRGAELGLTAMTALQNMYVVDGKVTLPAALSVGVVKRSELCDYFRCTETTMEKATYETRRTDDPEPTSLTYTREQARRAGLTHKRNWKQHPAEMLRARCSMQLARMVYEDLLAGVYTPDELIDAGEEDEHADAPTEVTAPEVDADGSIVDAEVDTPESASESDDRGGSEEAEAEIEAGGDAEVDEGESEADGEVDVESGGQPETDGPQTESADAEAVDYSGDERWQNLSDHLDSLVAACELNDEVVERVRQRLAAHREVESFHQISSDYLEGIVRKLESLSPAPADNEDVAPRTERILEFTDMELEKA